MSAAALWAEANAKDALADRITVEARALPQLLDPVAARTGPDVWRGPAADQFDSGLRQWRSTLDREAEVLLAVARRLRERAEQLREQARRVEQAEAQAAEAARKAAAAAQRNGARSGMVPA